MVARPSGGWGGQLDDCELIEVLNLTGTSWKDPLSEERARARNISSRSQTYLELPP